MVGGLSILLKSIVARQSSEQDSNTFICDSSMSLKWNKG